MNRQLHMYSQSMGTEVVQPEVDDAEHQETSVQLPVPRSIAPMSSHRRWLILCTVVVGIFMALLDVFVVNVAIPSISRGLRTSFGDVELVIASYTLIYAMLLITGGRLGDIVGRKRMFMLGVAGFTLASAGCGLAPPCSG
jgi:predicted MFS family arabinose efflux permease